MLILLTACMSSPQDSAADPWEGPPPVRPEWDASALELALSQTMSLPMPALDTLLLSYAQLMQLGEGSCPGDEMNLKDGTLFGCETSTGMYFSGVSEYWDQPRGDAWYRSLAGDFLLITPEGLSFEWGMGWEMTWYPKGAAEYRWMGSVLWQGDPSTADGVSVILDGSYDPKQLLSRHSGGMSIGEHTLQLDLQASEACPLAEGSLSLRGPEKRWYAMTLDCSGCAEAVFEGQELGQVCVDPGPLIQALERPMLDADWGL